MYHLHVKPANGRDDWDSWVRSGSYVSRSEAVAACNAEPALAAVFDGCCVLYCNNHPERETKDGKA